MLLLEERGAECDMVNEGNWTSFHLASIHNSDNKTDASISCLNPYPTVNSKSKKRKKNKERNKAGESDQNPKLIPSSQEHNLRYDPTKRLRNLRKKLHDTEVLEAKLLSGEIKNPEPEQLEKLSRKDQVEDDIKTLERVVAELSLAELSSVTIHECGMKY